MKDKTLYRELLDERNRLGWFHTPPAPEPARDHRSPEMIELVNRVLANHLEREKETKPWLFRRVFRKAA